MALKKQAPLLRSKEAVRPPPTPGRTVLGMPGEEAALRQRCRHGVPPHPPWFWLRHVPVGVRAGSSEDCLGGI